MSNQIPRIRLLGTVTGTGNVNLTSIVPNIGSLPADNFTVGQTFQGFLQAGTGADIQAEIGEFTYSASSPGAGILTRDHTFYSTNGNAPINFAADTAVEVHTDIPDIRIVHRKGNGTFHLLPELKADLGLPVITTEQSVTSGNISTLATCNQPRSKYEIYAVDQSDPARFASCVVFTGQDAGGGVSNTMQIDMIREENGFTIETSGVAVNLRNGSGSQRTFLKSIAIQN